MFKLDESTNSIISILFRNPDSNLCCVTLSKFFDYLKPKLFQLQVGNYYTATS